MWRNWLPAALNKWVEESWNRRPPHHVFIFLFFLLICSKPQGWNPVSASIISWGAHACHLAKIVADHIRRPPFPKSLVVGAAHFSQSSSCPWHCPDQMIVLVGSAILKERKRKERTWTWEFFDHLGIVKGFVENLRHAKVPSYQLMRLVFMTIPWLSLYRELSDRILLWGSEAHTLFIEWPALWSLCTLQSGAGGPWSNIWVHTWKWMTGRILELRLYILF